MITGGYMLMENTKGTADSVFTLWEVAKVTEEFFNACNGTNIMYLPPQEYQPQPRKECADAPPLASHKRVDYEDDEEEDEDIEDDHWTEVLGKSRSNTSTGTSTASSDRPHTGKIVNWFGNPPWV
jgi:hypothetical protein